jgi:hypothetical protein
LHGETLGLFEGIKDVLIKPFVPDGAIAALDIGILPGLSRLDMPDRNPPRLSPFQQLAADVFRAVVDTNGAREAAPFDDPVQAADDTFGKRPAPPPCRA